MKKFLVLVYFSILVSMSSGCASFRQVNQTRENLTKIQLGMSKGEVITIVGSPYESKVFVLENGQTFEVLKYLTQYDIAGPILNSDTTPICLQDGKVVGWGQKFYLDKKRSIKLLY